MRRWIARVYQIPGDRTITGRQLLDYTILEVFETIDGDIVVLYRGEAEPVCVPLPLTARRCFTPGEALVLRYDCFNEFTREWVEWDDEVFDARQIFERHLSLEDYRAKAA